LEYSDSAEPLYSEFDLSSTDSVDTPNAADKNLFFDIEKTSSDFCSH
jgi:hypothetical protein